MSILLEGKKIAEKIRNELKMEIDKIQKKPYLAVIIVGENISSKVYVNMKEKACKEVGIISKRYNLNKELKEEQLIRLIDDLNNDKDVNGILVQLPLPKHINEERILAAIDPEKDVDGFNPLNIGKLFLGNYNFAPCTPKGIIKLLEEYNISISGKDVVIVGRSNIVGKPLIFLLLEKDATVTICHSKTKDLREKTIRADILIVAVGKPKLITKDMVKENSIVIDVGINRIDDSANQKVYKLCGDVDFDEVKGKVSYITPVPGGVGPLTVAMLLQNTFEAYKLQNKIC